MFKTFPAFSKLTLDDREEFESYTKGFSPVSDACFVSLMILWEPLGGLAVSCLNGNLVMSYWIPGDEKHSGISLLGTTKVDESICIIFDHLRGQGDDPRLVNVPDFVVNSLRYPELFGFKIDGCNDEYVLVLSRFAEFESLPLHMRARINKFRRETAGKCIEVKEVTLSSLRNRQLLLDCAAGWPMTGVNNINKVERELLPRTISNGTALGVRALCMFVEGEVQAYVLYHMANNKEYLIVDHARVNYHLPRTFDYMVHEFSKSFMDQGIKYANIDADNGSVRARAVKIALKPDHFFRKYTIEPAR